jgi:hypothetical protein
LELEEEAILEIKVTRQEGVYATHNQGHPQQGQQIEHQPLHLLKKPKR